MIPHLQQGIKALEADNTSGAVALTKKAGLLCLQASRESRAHSPEEFQSEMKNMCRLILHTQPAMASFYHLTGVILDVLQISRDVSVLRSSLEKACNKFFSALDTDLHSAARHAQTLFSDRTTVLTHSSSSTLMEVFTRAASAGKELHVVCTESRPANEGRMLARTLAEHHISVTLITDAAAGAMTSSADVVLVGADSVTPEGVVNKMGSMMIALAAREHRVPVYSVCTTNKFLPGNLEVDLFRGGSAKELLSEPFGRIRVINRYFEMVPLELFTGIVTENGITKRADVRAACLSLRFSPNLIEMANDQ